MKLRLALLLLGLIASNLSAAADGGYVHEKSISVDEGTFLIRKFSLYPLPPLGIRITGEVTNNTNKDWHVVTFSVDFLDRSGNKIGTQDITIRGLNKGQTKSFEPAENIAHGVTARQVTAFDLRYKSGSTGVEGGRERLAFDSPKDSSYEVECSGSLAAVAPFHRDSRFSVLEAKASDLRVNYIFSTSIVLQAARVTKLSSYSA